MSVLAIAGSAIKIGSRIIQGVKNRRENKLNKAAQGLAEKQSRLDEVNQFMVEGIQSKQRIPLGQRIRSLINPNAGSQALSSSASSLQAIKAGNVQPQPANDVTVSGSPKMNPIFLLVGAGVLLFLLMRKR